MNKYAAYAGEDWKFDLQADDEREALARAKVLDETITRVRLISEGRSTR